MWLTVATAGLRERARRFPEAKRRKEGIKPQELEVYLGWYRVEWRGWEGRRTETET